MVSYNIGFGKTRPRFGRFSYVEKAEYWAVIWGTIIMVFTGFFLWFDNLAIKLFPKGFLDVMLVIHYYEAWLATLAIFIWHMYSTVFSPSVYPMNPAWYTGKMPLEQYRHEHPEDPDLVLQRIYIPYPKVGTYSVSVTPHPDALPTDTYGLTFQMGDASFTLADNMQIGDIPDEPYSVETTDAGVNCAPIAYSDDAYQGSEGSPITLNASSSYDPDGGSLQYRWDCDSDVAYRL